MKYLLAIAALVAASLAQAESSIHGEFEFCNGAQLVDETCLNIDATSWAVSYAADDMGYRIRVRDVVSSGVNQVHIESAWRQPDWQGKFKEGSLTVVLPRFKDAGSEVTENWFYDVYAQDITDGADACAPGQVKKPRAVYKNKMLQNANINPKESTVETLSESRADYTITGVNFLGDQCISAEKAESFIAKAFEWSKNAPSTDVSIHIDDL